MFSSVRLSSLFIDKHVLIFSTIFMIIRPVYIGAKLENGRGQDFPACISEHPQNTYTMALLPQLMQKSLLYFHSSPFHSPLFFKVHQKSPQQR